MEASESKSNFTFSNREYNDFVTKNELKIALFEFAQKYNLEFINLKINFLLWSTAALFAGMLSGFGFILKILFEISNNLHK